MGQYVMESLAIIFVVALLFLGWRNGLQFGESCSVGRRANNSSS